MKNQLKTILLLGALSALLIAIGGALGSGYLYVFTALALIMNLGAYFFSDRIVLAMHRAREVPGRRSLLSLFSTHPEMGERIRRLRGIAPSLERVHA
jgi:Zn-dependent protease with chaperone function